MIIIDTHKTLHIIHWKLVPLKHKKSVHKKQHGWKNIQAFTKLLYLLFLVAPAVVAGRLAELPLSL